MNGKLRAQPKIVVGKRKKDSLATVIMLRGKAISRKLRAQPNAGARERKSARAESLITLEQARREELERIHLQYAERIRQVEVARLEAEHRLEEQQNSHANLAEHYSTEATQRSAELLLVKDQLVKATEDAVTVEKRILDIESRPDAFETERRTFQETILTIRKQQADQAKEVAQVQVQLQTERQTLEATTQQYRGAAKQVTALQQRVTEETTARQVAEQALAQASNRLDETLRDLLEVRAAFLQQQLTQLTVEEQAKRIAVHEVEGKLLRLEAAVEATNQQSRGAGEQVIALQHRVMEEEIARQAAEQSLAQATTQLEQAQSNLQKERAALQRQLAQVTAEEEAKRVAVQEADGKLLRMETKLAETDQKYRAATEQLTVLQQWLTQEETARHAAEQALAQATIQLEQTQNHLQKERAALQQQLAQVTEERQVRQVAAGEATRSLLRLEAELEAANQQYRGATEQVTALQQRVTKEETVRQAAERTLAQVTIQMEASQRSLQEEHSSLQQRVIQEEKARQEAEQALAQTATWLEDAKLKRRQLATKEIPELKSKLETQYSAAREGRHALEQVRLELRESKKNLAETTRQLEKTRQQMGAAGHQPEKTRATSISFQLGYLLIHNFKSVKGILRLPSALWTLRKEVIRRRKKETFAPSFPKQPASSKPPSTISRSNVCTEPKPKDSSSQTPGIVISHNNLQPIESIGHAEHLLLTNHYPSDDDLYRNSFVHSRVCGYRERGVQMDVFRLRLDEAISHHEFEDVKVITASQETLHQMLSSGQYKSVLVHFLSPAMWAVLQHHIDQIKVFVWMHGAEFQPWHRRDFDYQTEEQRAGAKVRSDRRMAFWRGLLQSIPANLKLVFVSRYFAEEVMEDLGSRVPEAHYAIIHNPIDTDVFRYEKKSLDQRKKVLSVSSYASRKYATDLSARAIELLSSKPWFFDMEFRLIGDGPLFEDTVATLRKYKNVHIEQRFLKHDEIAALHKQYGIFLCPTRWDSHGISRDEAMSSGLVPVTNAVAAIPEFVDETCGVLVPPEDSAGLAEGIAKLYGAPELFSARSAAAADKIRKERSSARTIGLELTLFVKNES